MPISKNCPQISNVQNPSVPPQELAFSIWGGAHKFVQQYAVDQSMREDAKLNALHTSLIHHASVCSFCGVGCSYAVVQDSHHHEKLTPLSDLGLCVKGATSLLTGGEANREQRLIPNRP